MTHYENFGCLLKKIHSTNHYAQSTALKTIAARIQEANINDLQELLEVLILTHDFEIQIKLFSVLSAYLVSNGTNYEVIVKYHPLYESLHNLLIRGLPLKVATALNFVLALLCFKEGDSRQSLVGHARNMIRVSGCLNTMSDMFNSGMMYQDTWVTLCHSLAETCRCSDVNQSYCSHLVPLCVQRITQGNVDVCTVLQSLLQNHEQNIQFFLQSKGLTIFTRQLLQHSTGIQLLNTVVEKSASAVSELRKSDVAYHLRDFLHLYGPYSQMGQWATIILYHLNTQNKLQTDVSINNSSRLPQRMNNERTEQVRSELKSSEFVVNNNFYNPKTRVTECVTSAPASGIFDDMSTAKYRNQNKYKIPDLRNSAYINQRGDPNDTTNLFQNVIREVIYWKSKNPEYFKRPQVFHMSQQPGQCKEKPSVKNLQASRIYTKNQTINFNKSNKNLTFSFLYKDNMKELTVANKNYKVIDSLSSNCKMPSIASTEDKEIQTNTSDFYDNDENLELKNFRPPFISTPKRNKIDNSEKINTTKMTPENSVSLTKYSKRPINKCKNRPNHPNKGNSTTPNKEVIKKSSMSTRLFSVINESCTTIVKSMKNMFRTKQTKTDQTNNSENIDKGEIASCSYSFTNYMRQRDALLENDNTDNDNSSSSNYKVTSCKTCKDTIMLQHKMARDDNLKRTVKKLKIGINLYGCDFKKISKAVWPRDKHMTPEILYNLYRKLIVKGGHDNHGFRLRAHNIIKRK